MKGEQSGVREEHNKGWNKDTLRRMTAEELIDDLEGKIEDMDDLTFDEDMLDAYLEELENKEPLGFGFDAEATLAQFHAAHPEMDGGNRPAKYVSHRKGLRLAAGLVAATLGCMLVVQVAGVDIFGTLARWSDETFQFTSYGNTVAVPHPAPQLSPGMEQHFDSMQEALDAFGLDVNIVPTWIPEKFNLDEVTVRSAGGDISMDAVYFSDDDSFLGIMFEQRWSPNTFSVFEKDDGEITSLEKDGTIYYIMTNNAEVTAAWLHGGYECAIWGHVTKEEMIQIIDSIE